MVFAVKPGVPAGTIMQEISFFPPSRLPVMACTVTPLVIDVEPLVIKILAPLITPWPFLSSARVLDDPASEPAPGSVSPKAHKALPLHKSGRYFFFCAA